MRRTVNLSLFLTLFFLSITKTFSQVEIKGTIRNLDKKPLIGATIILESFDKFAITDTKGNFQINEVNSGEYIITVSYLGYKTKRESFTVKKDDISFEFMLEEDLLNLDNVVVTGNFDPRVQLESSTTVTTINSKKLAQTFSRGTADVLQAIPGTFTDPSAGEVFTKVYSRGISASAEDDIGWYYISLQEDGLPVSLIQHSYYTPELFHRLDLTTEKVEGIRGGSAAITALNAPGGIYNFISKGIRNTLGGEIQIQGGLQGESNPYYRVDGVLSGPLGKDWFFNVGGHYRYDDGARNTDFTFSKGGQLKFNFIRKNKNGYFNFYGKILDDFTNRYTGVAATNWENPEAAFGQDFNSTSLLLPSFSANIPDGRRLSDGETNNFDPSQGVHAQDRAFGIDYLENLGNGWSIKNNFKVSDKDANWQTAISNAFVSLNDPLAYFISGAQFPIGQIVFRDANTGEELSRVDNSGILTGESFQYLSASTLPNDAVIGTATWLKDNTANELINQLIFRKKSKNHDISFGADGGLSITSSYTQGSFAYATFEPSPRALEVTLENSGQPVIALSDENGVSNYGGLFYINSRARVTQLATFISDRWKIADKFHLDVGLRYENINHDGSNDRFAPLEREGGVDGNALTDFDNGLLIPTGEVEEFDFNYDYLSYSAGLNYKFKENAAIFARLSKGNKAPELDYYFNNFSNVPVNQEGEIQRINQAEIGLKWNLSKFSFAATAFWSQLENIGIGNFEFDNDTNSIFFTPIQFNSSRTIGLEWESAYAVSTALKLTFNGTLQNPIATAWTVYDASGTVPIDDDVVIDYSGNLLPFNPKFIFNLGTEYQKDNFNTFFKWQFLGEREGNIANAFQLPAYSIFNAGLGYSFNKHLSLNLVVTNLFNSEGLANFFGANSFGANANGVTPDFVQNNPDASFIVVPVLPRGTILKLGYTF